MVKTYLTFNHRPKKNSKIWKQGTVVLN